MAEIDRLDGSTDRIDLSFVERERTPRQLIEGVFSRIWRVYHCRIPNSISRGWGSGAVAPPFTTG